MSIAVHVADLESMSNLEIAVVDTLALVTEDGQVFRVEQNEHGGLRLTTVEGPLAISIVQESQMKSIDLIEVLPSMPANPMEVN